MTPAIRRLLEETVRVLLSMPMSDEQNVLYGEIQDALDRSGTADVETRTGAQELPQEYL